MWSHSPTYFDCFEFHFIRYTSFPISLHYSICRIWSCNSTIRRKMRGSPFLNRKRQLEVSPPTNGTLSPKRISYPMKLDIWHSHSIIGSFVCARQFNSFCILFGGSTCSFSSCKARRLSSNMNKGPKNDLFSSFYLLFSNESYHNCTYLLFSARHILEYVTHFRYRKEAILVSQMRLYLLVETKNISFMPRSSLFYFSS